MGICSIRYRLVCELLGSPIGVERRDILPDLRMGGSAVRSLVDNSGAFEASVRAVEALDCERLQLILSEAELSNSCFWICEWFCSWRCVLLCLELCGPYLAEKPSMSIDEMRLFAQATARLSSEGVLDHLLTSVEQRDASAFSTLVKEHQLERFCIQLCHWLCFRVSGHD